jgi:hypothetical protein
MQATTMVSVPVAQKKQFNHSIDKLVGNVQVLAQQIRPRMQDVDDRAVKIATELCVIYYSAKNDAVFYPHFYNEVVSQKGKDFFRKFVYWALYDELANQWMALKGVIDQIVGAMHVVNERFLFNPGQTVNTGTVQLFILTRRWGNHLRGLEACWAEYMEMGRAKAQAQREIQEEKDRVYAEAQAERLRAETSELAQQEGLTVSEYQERQRERAESEKAETLRAAQEVLFSDLVARGERVGNTGTVDVPDGFYLVVGGKLFKLDPTDLQDLTAHKISLLLDRAQ